MRYFLCVLGFYLLLGTSLWGQSVQAVSRVDTQSLRIGEPFGYTLSVSSPASYELSLPVWQDTLGGLDIIEVGKVDSSMQQGNLVIQQKLTLMGFDSGYYRIPAQEVGYRQGGGEFEATQTRAISVVVETVAVDTTADIRGIKEIIDQPLTFADMAPWIFGGLVFATLIGVGIWFYIRSKQDKPIFRRAPKVVIPPHEVAMGRLAKIESARYWQQGEIKRYYVEVTDTLRAYLEARFQIPAMESVTHEILRDLKGKSLSDHRLQTLRELLEQADLAKFAKFAPDAQDNMRAMETARNFVKNTRPTPESNKAETVDTSSKPS